MRLFPSPSGPAAPAPAAARVTTPPRFGHAAAPAAGLRVLVLTPYLPWPVDNGAAQRAFHTIRGLARVHRVTVASFASGALAAAESEAFLAASGASSLLTFDAGGCASATDPRYAAWPPVATAIRELLTDPLPRAIARWHSPDLDATLRALRADRSFDVVWAVRSWMAEHARAAGFERVVVDVDDVLSGVERAILRHGPMAKRQPLLLAEVAKLRRYERRLARRFPRLVLAKPEDVPFFRPGGDLVVVPNGVTVPPPDALPRPGAAAAGPATLLFVGTLGYVPNIDAVRYFAREVLPRVWARRPDVRFEVVGRGDGRHVRDALADPRCALVESAPDLAPHYARAAAVVTPVRAGGGTRIKVLEALAWAKPLVSTRFAAEGLSCEHGRHLLYADASQAMADACLRLLDDRALGAALGASGRAHVAARFEWEAIEATLPALVRF